MNESRGQIAECHWSLPNSVNVCPWLDTKIVSANNYDVYSSDTTNQRLKDGEKILQLQKYHNSYKIR